MKLHLNLTLRRALMAAMAMVTLHAADAAAVTPAYKGMHAYISSDGSLSPNLWNDIWNKHKSSTLTIGTYAGPAVVELEASTYNHGKDIYIGGTGYDSYGGKANDGELKLVTGTALNTNHISVGNSQVGGEGTLTMDGGSATIGSALFVGVNKGTGSITATNNASITVKTSAAGANFTMSRRDETGSYTDTVSLTDSSITVGTEGGVKDYTSIGHSKGQAILTLTNSKADFADQILVGEYGNGTIYVLDGSQLNLGALTILGHNAGAQGRILVDSAVAGATSTVKGGNIIVGEAGTGQLALHRGSTLSANNLTLGYLSTGKGDIEASSASNITIKELLTIGSSGTGSITVEDSTISASDIVLGKETTATGSLIATGSTISATNSLYLGERGTGTASIEDGSLSAKDIYVVGIDSKLGLSGDATMTADKLSIIKGNVTLEGTSCFTISGALTLADGGNLTVKSVMGDDGKAVSAGTVQVNAGSTLTLDTGMNISSEFKAGTLVNGGEVVIGSSNDFQTSSATNFGTIENAGNATINGSMSNYGSISNSGDWTTTGDLALYGSIENSGTASLGKTTVKAGASLDTTDGLVTIDSLENNGIITNTAAKTDGKGIIVKNTLTNYGSILNDGIWGDGSGTLVNYGTITGTGDLLMGKADLYGSVEAGKVSTSSTATLYGGATIKTGSVGTTGTYNIVIDSTTVGGTTPVITVADPTNIPTVKVQVKTADAAALVGKSVTFLSMAGTTTGLQSDTSFSTIEEGPSYTWGTLGTDGVLTGSYISCGDNKNLYFTSNADSATSIKDITFDKYAETLGESQATSATGSTVSLEYEKQVLTSEKKTADTATIQEDSALAEAILGSSGTGTTTPAPTLQTVVVNEDENTIVGANDASAKPVNMVVAAGLTENSTGLVVQTVVVNQVTKDDSGNVTETKTAGTTGITLVLSGESTQTGTTETKDTTHLGFADNLNGKTLKTDDGMEKKVQTIDLVQVSTGATVTLGNLNMHSTHNLVINKGATITFDGVNMKVGGSHDSDIEFVDVQVEVDDPNNPGQKKIDTARVENKESIHLDTGSVIGEMESDAGKAAQTTVHITNGSKVEFEKVYSMDGTDELGTTTIAGANTLVQMSGSNTTLGMDSVLKDDNGDTIMDDRGHEKHGQKIVFDHGAHLKGTGKLKNIHMKKGTNFTVGNSPGRFSASELTVDGQTNFYIITNSADWENYGGDNSKLTANEYDATNNTWGAISQLVVEGPVTLNGSVVFTYQEHVGNGQFANCADQEAARQSMGRYFQEGASIKFVDFAPGGELTLGSGFQVILETLPELEEGLFWDVNSLFTENTVYVISELLEEPCRVANSLVSAGETVLNFGRLAEAQAELREAGTTRTWGSAIAMFDSIDSGSNTNGYDYNAWGAAVGVDHAFTKNTVVGVAFGCTWGENEAEEGNGFFDGGSIDQDAKMVGIYGVHKFKTKGLMNDVKLNAFAAYGWFSNDSTRNNLHSNGTATADWDSEAWVLSASLSRDITTDSGVVFTPYVGVEYTTAGMDDFTEEGRSTVADYTADEDYSNLSVKVGVAVSKNYGSWTPYANIAFISDVDRTAAEVTAEGRNTVSGKSALPGRNAVQIGVGATWQLTENLDVNAGYSAELRDKATEQNARIGIGYTF